MYFYQTPLNNIIQMIHIWILIVIFATKYFLKTFCYMKLLITTFFLLLSIHISAQENDLEKKLGHDTFPYLTMLKNAVENRDTVLIGAVILLRGKHYEAQKMRREAIREYNKAYQLDSTRFKIASVYAKNIKLGMDAEHSTVLSQIEEESSRRTAVARAVVVTTAAVAQAYNESKNQTSVLWGRGNKRYNTSRLLIVDTPVLHDFDIMNYHANAGLQILNEPITNQYTIGTGVSITF